jgi:hypothetical protein
MIWFLRNTKLLDKPTAVKIAIKCAEHVIALYESSYPNDNRPKLAIGAAKAYLSNPSDQYQANAANAANAAYAATYAAANAANAATYAANAAYAAERKWQADKIREIVPNPFN